MEELVAAVLKAAFTPVLGPEEGIGGGGGGMRQCRIIEDRGRGRGGRGMRQCRIMGDRGGEGLLGLDAGSVDLVEVFPTGGGEGGGEVGDAEFLGFEGGGEKARTEAPFTARATLWFVFESSHLGEPCFVVVVAVNPWDVEAFGMAFAFVLANFVFFARVDVRVVVEDGGTNVVLEHPLDDGGGAGGTTGVEEDFVESVGDDDIVLFLHVTLFLGTKLGFSIDN